MVISVNDVILDLVEKIHFPETGFQPQTGTQVAIKILHCNRRKRQVDHPEKLRI